MRLHLPRIDGSTTRVYADGVEAANETLTAALDTWDVDSAGRPLPFRVGSQNEANGDATAGLRGSMTIARIRVTDQALAADAIAAPSASALSLAQPISG